MLASWEACTPVPALAELTPLGKGRSGHTFVQPVESSHGTFVLPSVVSTYTVRPFPSTRTVPSPETVAVLNIVPGDEVLEGAELADEPEEAAVLLLLEELQAAATGNATPRTARRADPTRQPTSGDHCRRLRGPAVSCERARGRIGMRAQSGRDHRATAARRHNGQGSGDAELRLGRPVRTDEATPRFVCRTSTSQNPRAPSPRKVFVFRQ
jgi:hypothetical protein